MLLSRCPDCDAAFGYTNKYGCPACGYHRGDNIWKLTPSRRERVMERDEHRCVFCGTSGNYWNPLGIDHIEPEIDGGDSSLQNLQTACRRCNSRKSDRSMVPAPWYGNVHPIDWTKDPEQRARRASRRERFA